MRRRDARALFVVLVLGLLVPPIAHARMHVVQPGDAIRAALAQAQPGDRITVLPGVYREGAADDPIALTVTRDGIALVGLSSPGHPVVLQNAGNQSYGLWVSPGDSAAPTDDPERPPCGSSGATLRGFLLAGFTLQGFRQHGAHLACVDGFVLTGNVADGNAVYGLFPVLSRRGVIASNEVRHTQLDAALYVGQSAEVLISANRVHDNLLGIEVENSTHCAVFGNDVSANTVGILIDVSPDKVRTAQEHTTVAFNHVHDNRGNTAPPEELLAVLPAGIGLLLVGADTTTVSGNVITRNDFVGLGVVSLCLSLALQGQPCTGLDVEPHADGNRLVGNVVEGNGTVPLAGSPVDVYRADLLWDATGQANCWQASVFTTRVPPQLPACHAADLVPSGRE
jgi:parallel beta-helix repeat protein